MQTFTLPLTLVQFLIPAAGAGILIGGITLYGYMSLRYRSRLYVSMTILALFALIFVGSEALILGVGGFLHDWKLSIRFHQSEHLAGAFFLFALPLFIENILELGSVWKKATRVIAYAGLIYAAVCLVSVVLSCDHFISASVHKTTWLVNEADYGRGQEGLLYFGRDVLLAFVILYSLASIAADLFISRRVTYLLFPIAGILCAVAGAAVDIGFVYKGINYDFFPHAYFSRFSLGITLFVLCLMSGLTRHFIDVAREVEQAHRLISLSEEKYRLIIEGTNDLLFTLDENMSVLSANKAALREFAVKEKDLLHAPFTSLVSFEQGNDEIERLSFQEKISALRVTGKPVIIRSFLKGRPGTEKREYQIRLEYIILDDGKKEIMGRAVVAHENALAKYMLSESQTYVIGNYLSTAEDLSKKLVSALSRHMSQTEILHLRLGLREIIINAIEHGNLGLTFEEKTELSLCDDYLSAIEDRQLLPAYAGRNVTVHYSLSPEQVVYTIEDEGEGFNTEEVMKKISMVNENELAHGRGISMAVGVFDSVTFSRKGNSSTLVKRFRS